MDKQNITEDMHLEKEWYEEADRQTRKSLPDFISKMMDGYRHDYGTACHAIAACTLATLNAMSDEIGITGFQYSLIKLLVLRYAFYPCNETALKVVNYDDMLYPQSQHKFEKVISKETFDSLQKQARKKLQEHNPHAVAREVWDHWVNIVCGIPPFGYTVQDNYAKIASQIMKKDGV